MARIRTIKPEAFVSESLAGVSVTAERTFFGLLTQVDDAGRIRDHAAILHGLIWPLRPSHTAADVEEDLRQLEKEGLVCRYQGPDGKRYLHLPTFAKHQKISHPTPSRLPECGSHSGPGGGPKKDSGDPPEPHGILPEGLRENPEDSNSSTPDGDALNAKASGLRGQAEPLASEAVSGNPPEPSGDSQPRAHAWARTRDLGSGTRNKELTPSSSMASPPDEGADKGLARVIPFPGGDAVPEPAEASAPKRGRGRPKIPDAPRPDVEALCARLAELMVGNGCKPPEITKKWRDAARLLLDTDKREFDKAMRLIDWCQKDEFWRTNILSMPTFRRQYEQLRLKAVAEWQRGNIPGQRRGAYVESDDRQYGSIASAFQSSGA
jgi:hypothetical protein